MGSKHKHEDDPEAELTIAAITELQAQKEKFQGKAAAVSVLAGAVGLVALAA